MWKMLNLSNKTGNGYMYVRMICLSFGVTWLFFLKEAFSLRPTLGRLFSYQEKIPVRELTFLTTTIMSETNQDTIFDLTLPLPTSL